MWIKLNDAIWDATLSPSVKLVALAIASYMSDRRMESYPSEAELALKTGLNKRTVIRSVQWLVDHDCLLVEHKMRPNSSWPTNHYKFKNGIRRTSDIMSPSDTVSPVQMISGDTMSPELVTLCHKSGDTMSHESSNESSINRLG